MMGALKGMILGTGYYLPKRVLKNHEFESTLDTSDTWIRERTGISERRIAAPEESTVDLSTYAAEQALANAGISSLDLDLIILATATPARWVPASSCEIQHRLGATKAAAFDLNAACSGFLYALNVANQFIRTGVYRYVLVIGTDTLSRIVNWEDRNTCVIFADGSGAVVLGPSSTSQGIISFDLGSEGSGADLLQVPAGGSQLPVSQETLDQNLHTVQMKGNEIFKLAVRAMLNSTRKALEQANLRNTDLDWVIPHQANIRIIQALAQRLEVELARIIITLDHHGNTSAASIPLALAEGVEQGKLKPGQLILLTGFGAGLTWGSMVIQL